MSVDTQQQGFVSMMPTERKFQLRIGGRENRGILLLGDYNLRVEVELKH